MEITLNNYSNGKIYKIINNVNNECYVGSTTTALNNRMAYHIKNYKNWLITKNKFVSSYNLFIKYGLENCKIELLEIIPCFNKKELYTKEAYYIKLLECVNIVIPNRTPKEYYIDNKDKIRNKRALYYIDNKDKIIDKKAEYRLNNKDKIKEYYNNNKDKILEKQKNTIY